MKIVIDAHTFSPFQIAGVSRYIYNLLMMLSRIDRENSYIVLANAFNLRWKTHIYAALLKVCGANFEIRLSSIPTSLSNRLFDFIWFRSYLPQVLHEEKPDLLPFEEAKLYGHNATHALLGFLAARRGCELIADAAEDPELMELAAEAFTAESGAALCRKRAGLDPLFTPEGYEGENSPNHADAAVFPAWASS